MITTIKIQTSKPLSGPKKFCLCSVVYTFLRPAVPELLTQLIKLFILLKHSLFYRLVIKQNLIANTWQHCFERQSVGLVRSIEILLYTLNICSLFSIRLSSVESIEAPDRERVGLGVEHPELEAEECGVAVQQVEILQGLRQEEWLLHVVLLGLLLVDTLHARVTSCVHPAANC